jgi:hypothetical protein
MVERLGLLHALLQHTTVQSNDDDHWRYSPDRALASLYGFHDSFYSTMWGYQLHDRPILDTLIQPSETSSSNYQRLSMQNIYIYIYILLWC